jgi:protein-tyrosine phosphatase
MLIDRHLDWDGCCNVRDLGGLRTRDGRTTRRGVLVRADSLARLREAGWAALWDYGIRTVIDLRNDNELASGDVTARPTGLTTVHVPIRLSADTAFMREYGHLGSTPLFFPHIMERRAARIAAIIAAVARAQPGGIAFHCAAGRDRTGLTSVLLLALAGVTLEEIVADYLLSAERLRPLYARLGRVDEDIAVQEILASANTTAGDVIQAFLANFDGDEYFRTAGLLAEDLAAIRARFLDPLGAEDQR